MNEFENNILERWDKLHEQYPNNQMVHDAKKDIGLLCQSNNNFYTIVHHIHEIACRALLVVEDDET